MLIPRYIVGFTGHRTLAPLEAVRRGIEDALKDLAERALQSGGMLEYYGSAASGADTLAAETAAELGIPVHIILPKDLAAFQQDFHDADGTLHAEDWRRASAIIDAALAGRNGGTLRVISGSQIAPDCYYEAGLQMLEVCDALIAVWDGKPARGIGGTEQIVTHARALGMPLIIIPADGTEQMAPENIEAFARADGEGLRLIRSVDQFSRETDTHPAPDAHPATELFQRLEACSNLHAGDFRDSLVRTIKWHGRATLVAAVAAILPQTALPWKITLAALAALELYFVARALWRTHQLHRGQVHERWMQTRFAAELMRAMKDSFGLLDPLRPQIARHHPQWRRFAITAALMLRHQTPPLPWREARDLYVAERLRSPDIRAGQIAYFSTKQSEAEPRFRRTLRWARGLGIAALVVVILALLYKAYVITAKVFDLPFPAPVEESGTGALSWMAAILFVLAPVALPLAAGILIALRTALDSGRRTYRYKELAARLSAAAISIEHLQTEASVRRQIANTEEVLLDELIEWHLAERQNGAH